MLQLVIYTMIPKNYSNLNHLTLGGLGSNGILYRMVDKAVLIDMGACMLVEATPVGVSVRIPKV